MTGSETGQPPEPVPSRRLPRRPIAVAAAAVGLVVTLVLAESALTGGDSPTVPGTGADRTTGADQVAGAGPWSGDVPEGSEPPAGAEPGATGAAAVPAPPGAAGGVPAYVQPFASMSRRTPNPPVPSPTGPVEVPQRIDGCDRDYGAPGQCVPWQFPAGATDPCAWLAARGFTELEVRGEDRHGLDTNGDGIACTG